VAALPRPPAAEELVSSIPEQHFQDIGAPEGGSKSSDGGWHSQREASSG